MHPQTLIELPGDEATVLSKSTAEVLWHVTVLSNFARGYDKYTRGYSKEKIPESTFPDRFFLLTEDELEIGIIKASGLLAKLALQGNRLLALRTRVCSDELNPNTRTGKGRFLKSPSIVVAEVAFVSDERRLVPVSVEEAIAHSLRLLFHGQCDYEQIKPHSFSFLPIARGCQASCPFCFSEASASAEQEQDRLDLARIRQCAMAAKERGAERFVITGGGEPGLIRHDRLMEVIATGHKVLGKTVLITNGHHLADREPEMFDDMLKDYAEAGLSVLAISRHHYDDDKCERLMSLRTDVAAIATAWRDGKSRWADLRLRLICVLQRGCIDSIEEIEAYVNWTATFGVTEICFKELYVSTSIESVYYRHAANEWSYTNQVPLSLVLEFAAKHGFVETSRLPWGAPVFSGEWYGQPLKIAAYTEPSLFWERTHGIARSWNLMADGRCLVSLEDRDSEITRVGAP